MTMPIFLQHFSLNFFCFTSFPLPCLLLVSLTVNFSSWKTPLKRNLKKSAKNVKTSFDKLWNKSMALFLAFINILWQRMKTRCERNCKRQKPESRRFFPSSIFSKEEKATNEKPCIAEYFTQKKPETRSGRKKTLARKFAKAKRENKHIPASDSVSYDFHPFVWAHLRAKRTLKRRRHICQFSLTEFASSKLLAI